MNGSLNWISLDQVYKNGGKKTGMKVRFNDLSHRIKFFTIVGESTDGRRFVGELDSGEKMSFSKKSRAGLCTILKPSTWRKPFSFFSEYKELYQHQR